MDGYDEVIDSAGSCGLPHSRDVRFDDGKRCCCFTCADFGVVGQSSIVSEEHPKPSLRRGWVLHTRI